jgi:hypothetical protein
MKINVAGAPTIARQGLPAETGPAALSPSAAPPLDPHAVPDAGGAVEIQHHHHHIPAFVEAELDRLYQNIYASLPKLLIYGGIDRVSTYVVRQGGEVITLWLFRVRGDVAEVLNELIQVSEVDTERFSRWLFGTRPGIRVIRFRAVRIGLAQLSLPFRRYTESEDIVVLLPASNDTYLQLLGKSTRKTIKGYHNKLLRACPDFRYDVLGPGEALDEQIRNILDLSRERMARKHKTTDYDAAETARVLRMCHRYGVIGIATANGKLCAGTITYRIGRHYFMKISAHDAAFDAYRLGNLVSYLCVANCIEAGGAEAHFLWGESDFKYSLHGVRRELHRLLIYRSHLQRICHPGHALSALWCNAYQHGKAWLHDGARAHRPLQTTLLDLSRRLRITAHL